MDINKDTRTEREKIIDKLLLLYVVGKMEASGQEVTSDRLQTIVFFIQTIMEKYGMETFHYTDWEWQDEA